MDEPIRRRSWIQIADIPVNRAGWEFSDCTGADLTQVGMIQHWLNSVKSGNVIRSKAPSCGMGLFLYGEPGHGKTTLALVALQALMREADLNAFSVEYGKTLSRPCYFITYSSLLELKGATMNTPTDEELSLWTGILGENGHDAFNVRVLVIDDVGKEHTAVSGWQKTMLHHVLRTRFNLGLPTIVTSNIPLSAWGAAYGDATESFAREAFMAVRLESPKGDLRK